MVRDSIGIALQDAVKRTSPSKIAAAMNYQERRNIGVNDYVRDLAVQSVHQFFGSSPWAHFEIQHLHNHLPLYAVNLSAVALLSSRSQNTRIRKIPQSVPELAFVCRGLIRSV